MQGVESVKVNEFKPVNHLKQWTVHMRTKGVQAAQCG